MRMRLLLMCLTVLLLLSGCYYDPNVPQKTEALVTTSDFSQTEETVSQPPRTEAETTSDPDSIPNVPDEGYTKIY